MRLWGIVIAFALAGCAASSQVVCKPDPITGSERCSQSGGYGDAAITGASAAAVWGVAGCTVNGCEPPFRCNGKTKLCERLDCSETTSCPPGYQCDLEERRCY